MDEPLCVSLRKVYQFEKRRAELRELTGSIEKTIRSMEMLAGMFMQLGYSEDEAARGYTAFIKLYTERVVH